jgi:hypothetical protein
MEAVRFIIKPDKVSAILAATRGFLAGLVVQIHSQCFFSLEFGVGTKIHLFRLRT